MIQNTDYHHLVEDVGRLVKLVEQARETRNPDLEREYLFRAGLRLMRAEKGLEAIGNVITSMMPETPEEDV